MPPFESQPPSCVGTGLVCLDVIRDMTGSRTTERRLAGGSCGNVLSILSYLGWTTSVVGRIGADRAGGELVADLEGWGVGTDLLKVEAGRGTPIIVQENYVDAKGRPRHRFSRACPGCGASLPAYRPILLREARGIADELPSHSVFYFDRVARGNLVLAQRSRAEGALVVFEPSGIKDLGLFEECLRAAHVTKYAHDRLRDIHDVVENAEVPVEIETLGAKGLRLRVRNEGQQGPWQVLPAFPTPSLRDAAGSGDWCTAGLIEGLLSRRGSWGRQLTNTRAVVQAARLGQAFATINCGFDGARGLMYATDAESAVELARARVAGAEAPVVRGRSPNARGERRGAEQSRLFCSGSRSMHL